MFGDQNASTATYTVLRETENESDDKQREFTVMVFFAIGKRPGSTCVVISVAVVITYNRVSMIIL